MKQTCHYAFMSSQVQNKLPLCALRACVNSQDQNRVPSCICELPRPKQTLTIHLWPPKIKSKHHYAYLWTFTMKSKCHYAYLSTLTIKSNVHYTYLWTPKTRSHFHNIYLWTPKTKIGPQYAFVSSLILTLRVFMQSL